jgi:hypothetical protein
MQCRKNRACWSHAAPAVWPDVGRSSWAMRSRRRSCEVELVQSISTKQGGRRMLGNLVPRRVNVRGVIFGRPITMSDPRPGMARLGARERRKSARASGRAGRHLAPHVQPSDVRLRASPSSDAQYGSSKNAHNAAAAMTTPHPMMASSAVTESK